MSGTRSSLAIAAVELRRFMRDRSNIFFVFIFPLLLVAVIGSQFGGGPSHGTVVVTGEPSDLRSALVTELTDADVNVSVAGADAAAEQLARGRTDVGVTVPAAAVDAFDEGTDLELEMVLGSGAGSAATAQTVRDAVQALSSHQGQIAALVDAGADAAAVPDALAQAEQAVTPATVRVVDVDEIAQAFAGVGQFDVSASSQLLLFVFLTSLAGSATLIQGRRYRVIPRMLSAPVSTGQVIGGEALGRFVIAGFQGVYIMVVTALLFGVDWGDLTASVVVLATFSAVAAGAAMVIGSLLDNEGAATGLGIGAGLVLAALGGGMLPLELFPDGLRTVAHFTPHAWAYEAFAEIQRHEGTVVDVLPQLGVLVGMAVVLLVLGSWLLRRSLVRAL